MRLVLDASAALAAVLKSDSALLNELSDATAVYAPDLFAAEVANGLWKYVRSGEITRAEASEALTSLLQLVDRFIGVDSFAQEALSEAARHEHPVYDLCYAVAARREGCTVLTIDAKLRKLLKKMGIPYTSGARA